MRKIVSIDFDIVMAPTITYYNNLVPGKSWDEIEDPLLQLSYPDVQHYQSLTEWLFNIIDLLPRTKIHFIESHEMILDFLNSERIILYNIDHHHDLEYGGERKDNLPNCADWVEALYEEDCIESYIWINNENSDSPPDKEDLITESFYLKNFNLAELAEVDELFICFSPQWIPPKWRPLYFLWMDYCNIKFNTHFDIYAGKNK